MTETAVSQSLWQDVKEDLRETFSSDIFQMWFEPLRCVEAGEDHLVLGAPNDFAVIWLQDNYCDLIAERLRLVCGRAIELSFKQCPPSEPAESSGNSVDRAAKERPNGRVAAAAEGRRSADSAGSETRGNPNDPCLLNPRNSFENYVVGSNNQLAHAACIAVCQAPAQAYNPLFLYGDTGLGKTHLMQAVGHQILKRNESARIAYVSSEKFTNEFITAIQENTLTRFRKRYRHVDILLIDDIHFLSGKERIQEEFFHTFNDLFESQKQIVLTSDRPASEIEKLENRLISRFQWGLVTDIQAPDFETRLAILRNKAKNLNFEIGDEILNFIAKRISKNIRRLEGSLIKVASYSGLTGNTLDLQSVERLLGDILQEEAQNQITIEMIQKKVVDFYELRVSDMVSKRRPNNIAFPRQIAMYLSRILTKNSLQEIGEAFGGRDHGTVMYACRTVENMMEQEESIRTNVEYLKNQMTKGL